MFGAVKKKLLSIAGIFVVLVSSMLNLFLSNDIVSASTAVYEQSYVEIKEIYREDNDLHVILKDTLLVKDMTYEYTHVVDDVFESDLVVVAPKQLSTTEYLIELPEDTIGVKVWKVKHQVEDDYYKNKYTTGPNTIGDINTKQKKNYITVTADDLVAYEYSSQNLEFPWYTWSPAGVVAVLGDYLFTEEKSASYTWYFNIDKEVERIIDVNMTYATFEYSEILWGAVESKHNYQSHGPVKITADTNVFDYEKFVSYAEENCGLDFAGGTCNNKLKEQGEAYFQRPAIGSTDHVDEDGNIYDWYVQITLNDLLHENNVLWGAYENKEYLQEVTLLEISYYFEGEEYFDVAVLDEDTGELDIIPDTSPIDRFVSAIDSAYDWVMNAVNWIKDHMWIVWLTLGVIVFIILCIFWRFTWGVIKVVWKVSKWTILLPFTLIYYLIKNAIKKKKKKKNFEKLMDNYKKDQDKIQVKSKKKTRKGKKS